MRGVPFRPDADRRRSERYDFLAPVRLSLHSPEEVRPSCFTAETCDLSAGGMLIEVEDKPEDLYEMLVWAQKSKSSIFLPLPARRGAAVFPAKIVWYDYQSDEDIPRCRAAVSFGNMEKPERRFLNALLERLDSSPVFGQSVMSA